MPMTTSIGVGRKISRPALSMSPKRKRNRVLRRSRRRRCHSDGGTKQRLAAVTKAVEERLAALRNLIPSKTGGAEDMEEEAAGDRLFEETAEYILCLRTQVEILKRLVDIYRPCVDDNGGCARNSAYVD